MHQDHRVGANEILPISLSVRNFGFNMLKYLYGGPDLKISEHC